MCAYCIYQRKGCWLISYVSGGSRYYALGNAAGGKSDSYRFDGKSGEVFFPQWRIGDKLVTVVVGAFATNGETAQDDGCRLLLHSLNTQR